MHLEIDGYHIDKDYFTDAEYTGLKNELKVKPTNNMFEKDEIVYKQYRVTDDEIIIPKFFGNDKFKKLKRKKEAKKADINFLPELRDYQKPITEKCIQHILQHGGCQLSVPCGRGKTVMAIYIAHKLGLKTLILVHKSFLQDQWIERIKQFTGLDCGIIRRDEIDTNFHFVVGMIQSIGSRDYGDIYNDFGLVICDECHHYASAWFSQSISKVTGLAYTLGLSATLYRNDGMVKVIYWYLGDVAYKEKMKSNNQVCVKVLTYNSSDTKRFVDISRQFKGRSLPNCTSMINNIVEIDSRNKILISVINELRKNPNRKILILSGRKESHLHMLKIEVDKLIEKDIKENKIIKDECKTYFYTGDTKQKDRFEAEKNADVLFATYEMAQEGLDIERLNTVILSTPKKDVVQAVGRVLRKILKDGDIRPLIIDIVDDFSIFKSQAIVRENFYKKNNYVLNYYYLYDDAFISPKEYINMNGSQYDNYSEKKPKSMEEMLKTQPVEFTIDDSNSNSSNSKSSRKSEKKKLLDLFGIIE
jgi:superfamily II DNA or RNA helicase